MHFLVPLLTTAALYRTAWLKSYLLLMSAMLIDLDHLLANPIYDAGRCSISFHPLHTWVPIILYICAAIYPKTRLVGVGLCIHILLDAMDCFTTK